MNWQWVSSVTVSTVPGHLLLSITLPPVQHPECQNPTALTSTHAAYCTDLEMYHTNLIPLAYESSHGDIIEINYSESKHGISLKSELCFFVNGIINLRGGDLKAAPRRSQTFAGFLSFLPETHKIDILPMWWGRFIWELIKWAVCCLRCVRTDISFIFRYVGDGWLMTSTLGCFQLALCPHPGPLDRGERWWYC